MLHMHLSLVCLVFIWDQSSWVWECVSCFCFQLVAKTTLCLDWASGRISDLSFCLSFHHTHYSIRISTTSLHWTKIPNGLRIGNANSCQPPFYFPCHLPPCEASLICSPLLWVRGLQAVMVSDEATVLCGTQRNGGVWALMQLLFGCAKFQWKGRGQYWQQGVLLRPEWRMGNGGRGQKGICVVFNQMERKWKEKGLGLGLALCS